ncbi:MAG: hypothetical protein HY434_01725 [Candidatus Liptonbacteria bacterium]|nr:hypothetical protein [Candidatus Liptonbacteria bacterium]
MSTRIVSPNVITANIGKRKLMKVWDRFPYSPKTQYREPIKALRKNLRALQAQNGIDSTPLFWVDCSQGILHLSREGLTWCGTLGGLMDPTSMAEGNIPDLRAEVFQDKVNKRLRYGEAGELVRPSLTIATLEDELDPLNGPVTFWNYNPRIMDIVEKNKKAKPFVTLVCYINDVQIGSGTSRPEAVEKTLDYTFYHLVPKYAKAGYDVKVRVVILGDYHHGDIGVYRANASENYVFGLMSIRSQQAFGMMLLEPNLHDPEVLKWVISIEILTGNHCWDSMSAQLSGRNDLMPEWAAVKTAVDTLRRWGKLDHDIPVNIHGRSRVMSASKEGDPINWPMCVFEDHGYVIYNTHKIGRHGEPMKLIKQFAEYSSYTIEQVTHFFQGHYHHPELRQIGDVLYTILGAYAGVSGLEANLGMHAYTMPMVGIITNAGFGMHFIPYDWLMERYKCKGALRAVDAAGDLNPPAPGTSSYGQGKRSPWVESTIWDKIHQHPRQLEKKHGCKYCL